MKFPVFQCKALLVVGAMTWALAASAQVVGGGGTLPEGLYGGAQFPVGSTGILNRTPVPGFNAYVGVGSGAGKSAFFQNNSNLLVWNHDANASTPKVPFYPTPVTVDYAGSESLVTAAEETAYDAHPTLGKASFGPLIQVPVVLAAVTVPYNIPGRSSMNLTSAQLAQIFADPTVTHWNQVAGFSTLNQPIKVIYRAESSGTTEIFLRHLNAVNNTLVPSVGSTYASVVNVGNASKYIPVTGSDGVMAALLATPYAIAYVSPERVALGDPTKVVAISRASGGVLQNFLPSQVDVAAALGTPVSAGAILPPTGPAATQARNWGIGYVASGVSPLANPSRGYPIVGATHLIFSQCYASAADNTRIRNFFAQHYGSASGDVVHPFIKLPAHWRTAIYNTFFATNSVQRIGNPDVCTGKGRPI